MSKTKQKTLIFFAALSVGMLMLSNLAAMKHWTISSIAIAGGVLIYPFIYILSDLIIQFYGKRIAKIITFTSFWIAFVMVLLLFILEFLPLHVLWYRTFLALFFAFLASNYINNALFLQLRNRKKASQHFYVCSFSASAVAYLIAAAIFEFITYLAILPLYEILLQLLITFFIGIILNVVLSLIGTLIENKLQPDLCEYQNNNQFYFEITKRIPGKLGRAGIIHTPHGDIHTPAFMTVGTRGEVRYLSMHDLHSIHAQAMLSNGYHLRNISPTIADQGGLAKWSGWQGPTLTDSGGFQVMSLGSGCGKVVSMEKERNIVNTEKKDRLAIVTEKGVHFHDPFTDQDDFIGPKESMEIQCRIGADIHMAYDELTSLADTYEYNKDALARTERWAKKSIHYHRKHCDDLGYHQSLYGVLQGGRWEDLRRSTAKKFAKMDFDGYGLGGAFLKETLGDILRWCCEELPENKPRHLLGLSHPDDILIGTEMGADTFDCVAPTREARHGRIYTRHGNIAIKKFADSNDLIEEDCDCPTCRAGWTRGQLRALLKSSDPKDREKYFNLASMHNLRFIIRLTEEARQAILDGTFEEYKTSFLKEYYQNKK